MSTLYVALTIALVFVSIALIALVLLQKGKGADAGAAFGAGASGTVFGARGSTNFLSRSTAILATTFFVVCLALAYLSAQQSGPSGSLLDDLPEPEPALPAAPAEDSMELDIPEEAAAELPLEIPEEATPPEAAAEPAPEGDENN